MIVIDANLLLYACKFRRFPAAHWLSKTLGNGETIALPWVTIRAFLRISTNSRIRANPMAARDAFAIVLVNEWLTQPAVVRLHPGPVHAEILAKLITDHGCNGPLITHAVIAALAIEHRATPASTDQEFRRFPDLRLVNRPGN